MAESMDCDAVTVVGNVLAYINKESNTYTFLYL